MGALSLGEARTALIHAKKESRLATYSYRIPSASPPRRVPGNLIDDFLLFLHYDQTVPLPLDISFPPLHLHSTILLVRLARSGL